MNTPVIFYSCYFTQSLLGENFVPEHLFTYQVSGTLQVSDGVNDFSFVENTFRLSTRNSLARFMKVPPPGGQYKTVSVQMSQEFLRTMSQQYNLVADHNEPAHTILTLPSSPLLQSYVGSLEPYYKRNELLPPQLEKVKREELVLILLQVHPGLKNVLFDFRDPDKINLEDFMQRNFRFNVSIERFAYLTGRSLTGFKQDFKKIFNTAPGRWLQQRRLQEAHYLIGELQQKPSDVYLDVGFEDLSHFSFAFKKAYGVPPSQLLQR